MKLNQKLVRDQLVDKALLFFQENLLHIEVLREGDNQS